MNTQTLHTLASLCAEGGVHENTGENYLRLGLLKPALRTPSGIRLFTPDQVNIVRELAIAGRARRSRRKRQDG